MAPMMRFLVALVICSVCFCSGEAAVDESASLEEKLSDARSSARRCLTLVKTYKEGAMTLERMLKECKTSQVAMEKKQEADKGLEDQLDAVKLERDTKEMELQNSKEKLKQLDETLAENERLKQENADLKALGKSLRKQVGVFERDANDAIRALEVEKELTERLETLCKSKGTDDAIQNVVVHNKQQNVIQQLEMKVTHLQEELLERKNSNVDEVEELKAELRMVKKSLAETKDRLVALRERSGAQSRKLNSTVAELKTASLRHQEAEDELEEAKRRQRKCSGELKQKAERLEKNKADQVAFLEEKEELQERIQKLEEAEMKWKEENEALAKVYEKYKAKAENPLLADFIAKRAKWLNNPQVDGFDRAYDKTLKVIGPKLNRTELVIKELTALLDLSSKSLTRMVGKPEMSPVVSGLLTYGILLIPLTLSMCLVVRVKRRLSLAKLTTWMTLYNTLFCLAAFGLSFVVKGEPMLALREHNEETYEFLQLLLGVAYTFYFTCLQLLTVNQCVFANRCALGTRQVLQIGLPSLVAFHYYQTVWLLAMKDKPPVIEEEDWAYYAVAFTLIFISLTFCKRTSPAGAYKPVPTVIPPQQSGQSIPAGQANISALEQGVSVESRNTEEEDIGGASLGSDKEDEGSAKKAKKSKKKKKHKHGHRVAAAQELEDDSAMIELDIVNPDKLVEEAETLAEAATTGAPIKDIKERKSKEKRSKKKHRREASSEDDDDLEVQKLD